MLPLLGGHAGDQGGALVAAAEHGELARINPGRAIFPGLVDAQHRRHVRARIAGAPAAHAARGFLRLSHRMTNAEASERIAFHPAIEIPSHDHWTSSQRTHGATMIDFSMSSTEAPLAVEVQVVRPSNQPGLTPAGQKAARPPARGGSAGAGGDG